jgi:hypothetical protein
VTLLASTVQHQLQDQSKLLVAAGYPLDAPVQQLLSELN